MSQYLSVNALYAALEARLPRTLSCEGDNDGLSVCPDGSAAVSGVMVALEPTEDVLDAAMSAGCNVILTHHPLIFSGLTAVTDQNVVARRVIRLLQNGMSAMAFHTRLDTVAGGVNDTLAARLGLLGWSDTPQDGLTGAGFLPFGMNSNPAHAPMGRMGRLPQPESFDAFIQRVKVALHTDSVMAASCGTDVYRVAVLGGMGKHSVEAAFAAGADTYITGELSYHQLCDAPFSGMNLIAAGHDITEFPVTDVLAGYVRDIAAAQGQPTLPVHICPLPRKLWY